MFYCKQKRLPFISVSEHSLQSHNSRQYSFRLLHEKIHQTKSRSHSSVLKRLGVEGKRLRVDRTAVQGFQSVLSSVEPPLSFSNKKIGSFHKPPKKTGFTSATDLFGDLSDASLSIASRASRQIYIEIPKS